MNGYSDLLKPWPRYSMRFGLENAYKAGVLGIPRKFWRCEIDRMEPWSEDQAAMMNALRDMAEDANPPQALIVSGVNHCGKTYIGCGMVSFLAFDDGAIRTTRRADGTEDYATGHRNPRYVNESDLLNRFTQWSYRDGKDWFSIYSNDCGFLVIDEFGTNKWTETEARKMCQVLNKRFNNGLQTVILTNRSQTEVFELLSKDVQSRFYGCLSVSMTHSVEYDDGAERREGGDDQWWLP